MSGKNVVFADILTRWAKDKRDEKTLVCSILREADQFIPSAGSIDWPEVDDVRSAQAHYPQTESTNFDESEKLWKEIGRILVPQQKLELISWPRCALIVGSVGIVE